MLSLPPAPIISQSRLGGALEFAPEEPRSRNYRSGYVGCQSVPPRRRRSRA
jgi:hypothetical protein